VLNVNAKQASLAFKIVEHAVKISATFYIFQKSITPESFPSSCKPVFLKSCQNFGKVWIASFSTKHSLYGFLKVLSSYS